MGPILQYSGISVHGQLGKTSLKINSQSSEDTQVGYILQKYTLDKYTLEEYTLEEYTLEEYTLEEYTLENF